MRKGVIPAFAIVGLILLLAYSIYLGVMQFTSQVIGDFLYPDDISLGFATDSNIQVVGVTGTGFIIFNSGSGSVSHIYLVVDDMLVDYELTQELPPMRAVEVELPPEAYNMNSTISAVDTIISYYSGDSVFHYSSYCDDSNYCTLDSYYDGNCSHTNYSDGFAYGCSGTTGCTGDLCSCVNGSCTDTCGNMVCESSWESPNNCLADCNNCAESFDDCSGVWFYGGITISDGSYCACCGDDGVNDNFNNGTHYCSQGLVFTNIDSNPVLCEQLGYSWLGSSTIDFGSQKNITIIFTNAFSISSADIDGDGDLDMVGSNINSAIGWWENNLPNSWTPHVVDSGFASPFDVAASDIDSDGDADILSVSESGDAVALWKNNGDGTAWTKSILTTYFDGASSVAAADIDNDGDLDVVSSCANNHDIVWLENGNNWMKHVITDMFSGVGSVQVADMNGDGLTDAVGAAANSDEVAWFENNGTGWEKHLVASDFNGARNVAVFDIDGDGDLDIIGTAFYNNSISWFENNGNDWVGHLIASNFRGASIVAAADIDNDGDGDIVGTATSDNSIVLFENTGSGWSQSVISSSFGGAYDVLINDLDGDGDLDIIGTAITGNIIGWWENTGISGINGPCCGDDDGLDNFNSTNYYCVNGTVNS